jgi:tRNA pseudouridine synthase 10
MEIFNPKLKYKPIEDIKKIQESINNNTSLIQINELAMCDKSHYAVLKKYEDSKQKNYTCLVWVAKLIDKFDIEKINDVKDLEVIQKTPMRVMHRRTLMDRKKIIFKMEARQINDNFMVVDVLASAGTYIKEFIHSDLGRTNPSLMTILGCECDILQLDVMNIIYGN